jgi:hypothetical protein
MMYIFCHGETLLSVFDQKKVLMKIADTHIGYCLNIYPGETAGDVARHIGLECPRVKTAVSPDADMGVGLWLAAEAARQLRPNPQVLAEQLADQGLYAFTINAFPFGDFHSRPVKERVYLPDWSSPDRVAYTLDAAHILARLLPACVDGSISTVPVAYGKNLPKGARDNLVTAAAGLEKIELKTGRLIRLALEPEPDCFLEGVDEAIAFFEELRKQDRQRVDRYLGICLDVCHTALQFEDPVTALKKLGHAGINIPKIQISAALEITNPTIEELRHLQDFDDGVYLHQTRVQQCGNVFMRYADLPEALAARPPGLWRIHFHVPLHFQSPRDRLCSTAGLLSGDFFRQALKHSPHLETETYTYGVLPHQQQDISASVSAELQFVVQAVQKAIAQ